MVQWDLVYQVLKDYWASVICTGPTWCNGGPTIELGNGDIKYNFIKKRQKIFINKEGMNFWEIFILCILCSETLYYEFKLATLFTKGKM